MAISNNEKVFTTFEAAQACGVFHTTVINWVNKGKLKAHHTPGRHRRIRLSDLLAFMQRFDMPIPPDLVSRPKKILIVEDDAAVRGMIGRALEGMPGVQAKACAGGLEALVEIGKETPDLLVLDIRIPKVNGLQVCEVLKAGEHTQALRIIAVSGEALSGEEEASVKALTDAYFRKPLSTSALRSTVAQLLELEGAFQAAGSN